MPSGNSRLGLSALQKCTVALRVLAYGTSADAVDEYMRMRSTVVRESVIHFVEGVISISGTQYLRKPNEQDVMRLLQVGDQRGFPGMMGIIDCMHWEWKNCPTAWAGQFAERDRKRQSFWKRLRHTIYGYGMHSSAHQAIRKDVKRAFGVLQARFAYIKRPCLVWDRSFMGKIMTVCIIVHNMIVEDERDTYQNCYDTTDFQEDRAPTNEVEQGEDDLSHFSTRRSTLFENYMKSQSQLRSRETHNALTNDLIKHVWRKFGHRN